MTRHSAPRTRLKKPCTILKNIAHRPTQYTVLPVPVFKMPGDLPRGRGWKQGPCPVSVTSVTVCKDV